MGAEGQDEMLAACECGCEVAQTTDAVSAVGCREGAVAGDFDGLGREGALGPGTEEFSWVLEGGGRGVGEGGGDLHGGYAEDDV